MKILVFYICYKIASLTIFGSGRVKMQYTMRLNSSGRFELPPTRVEAMYSPALFGELPNARFEVTP